MNTFLFIKRSYFNLIMSQNKYYTTLFVCSVFYTSYIEAHMQLLSRTFNYIQVSDGGPSWYGH